MQIQNNPQLSNQINTSSFRAIKIVKCVGLYKKYPQYAEKLVKALNNNAIAMRFCRNNDVDVVIRASEDVLESVHSLIQIFYKDPNKKPFKKFCDFICGKKEEINLNCYSNLYDIEENIGSATNILIEKMSFSQKGNIKKGQLNDIISKIEMKMKQFSDKKLIKEAKKLAKNKLKEDIKIKQIYELQSLNNSIDKLIKNSK